MKAAQPKTSQAVKDGQAAGRTLADHAAALLLVAYNNRSFGTQSASTRAWSDAWGVLIEVLGTMAKDPAVLGALHELDEAHGEGLVEHEDAAWHAAWTAAMSLRGR